MKLTLLLRPLSQHPSTPAWVQSLGLVGAWCLGLVSGFLIAGLVVYLGSH